MVAATTEKKVKYVCTECGCDEIKCDAWATWDEYKQRWILDDTFDMTYCPDCDGTCTTREVEINE